MNNMLIIWGDIHETGIAIIDEQHRGIVSTINSLYYFMRRARGEDVMLPVLGMIEEYTRIHFRTEEELLRAAGYPDLEAHIRLHRKLIERMFSISRITRETNDPAELLDFLKDWWHQHINEQDHLYVECLAAYARDHSEIPAAGGQSPFTVND